MTFCRSFFRGCLPVLLPVIFAVLLHPLNAQTSAGPVIKDIVVENLGAPGISKERVLANLATKVGAPYSERAAEQDIRALYATGGVSNVRIFAEPLGDGVKVTVLLQGRPVIQEILIEGTDQIPLNRVRREIGTRVGDVVSEEKIEDDRQKIIKLYEDRNYSEIDVQYKIQEVPGNNRSKVIYSINEGPKLIVKRITFVGNESVLSRDLKKVMKTKAEDILSFFTKSGRLVPSQVEEDRAAIKTLYQNRGFADVEVSDDVRREGLAIHQDPARDNAASAACCSGVGAGARYLLTRAGRGQPPVARAAARRLASGLRAVGPLRRGRQQPGRRQHWQ